MTPDEATLAWTRNRADNSAAFLATSGNKIATWLLIGNAGALVLVLKASVEGALCESILLPAARLFSVGLFLAFSGWATSYVSTIFSVSLGYATVAALSTVVGNSFNIERLEAEFGDAYRPGLLEAEIERQGGVLTDLQRKIRWLWLPTVMSMCLFTASAVSFGLGTMKPILGDSLTTCAPAAAPIANDT